MANFIQTPNGVLSVALRKNEFKVSNDGYFVYCNGIKDKEAFNEVLEFDVKVLHYEGNDSWVDNTVYEIAKTIKKTIYLTCLRTVIFVPTQIQDLKF